MYHVKSSLPSDTVSELDPGTNLLIAGPPLSGKRELTLELLTDGQEVGDGMFLIMTSESAMVVIEDLERWSPTLDRKRIGVVDCTDVQGQTIKDVATRSLSSPQNLTEISTAAARLLQQLSDNDVSKVRHGLISVSTLLEYLDLDTVFKFLHIYTQRIADTQGLGVFTIDNTIHEPQVITTLTSEFDGVIKLRQVDTGEREMRIQGLAGVSDTWYSFETEQ